MNKKTLETKAFTKSSNNSIRRRELTRVKEGNSVFDLSLANTKVFSNNVLGQTDIFQSCSNQIKMDLSQAAATNPNLTWGDFSTNKEIKRPSYFIRSLINKALKMILFQTKWMKIDQSCGSIERQWEPFSQYTISRKRQEEAISGSSLGKARRKNGANKTNPIWTFSKSQINNEQHHTACKYIMCTV